MQWGSTMHYLFMSILMMLCIPVHASDCSADTEAHADSMQAITEASHINTYIGSIVAYRAPEGSPFYSGYTVNGAHYGYITTKCEPWYKVIKKHVSHEAEMGYQLKRLRTISYCYSPTCCTKKYPLVDSMLRKQGLYMREATREEKKMIRALVENNKARFECTYHSDEEEMINNELNS